MVTKKRKEAVAVFNIGDRVKVTEEAVQKEPELTPYKGIDLVVESILTNNYTGRVTELELRSLKDGDLASFSVDELEHVPHPAEVLLDEMARVLRETSCKTAPRDCTNNCMDGLCDCSGLFRYSDNVSDILKAYDKYKEGAGA